MIRVCYSIYWPTLMNQLELVRSAMNPVSFKETGKQFYILDIPLFKLSFSA